MAAAAVSPSLRAEDCQEQRSCCWCTWLNEPWPAGDLWLVLAEPNSLPVAEQAIGAHPAFALTGFDAACRIGQRCWPSWTCCRWREGPGAGAEAGWTSAGCRWRLPLLMAARWWLEVRFGGRLRSRPGVLAVARRSTNRAQGLGGLQASVNGATGLAVE